MICKQCGKEFVKKHYNEKYCSEECRKQHLAEYHRKYNGNRNNGLVYGKCCVCGAEIYGRTNKKYCSDICARIGFWQHKLTQTHQEV